MCNLTSTLLFSLFFITCATTCSEIDNTKPKPVRQPALSLHSISYNDDEIRWRRQLQPYSQLEKPCIEYGFTNNNVALTYNEKHERGVVHIGGNVLQRLKIPKEQFLKIATIEKENSSIAQLEYNKEHTLTDPLYIAAKGTNQFLLYKIHLLRKSKPSEIDEAGYSSDIESKVLAAGAIGFSGGFVAGGMVVTFFLFLYKLRQLYYAC